LRVKNEKISSENILQISRIIGRRGGLLVYLN